MGVFFLKFISGADSNGTFENDDFTFWDLGKNFINNRVVVFLGGPIKRGGNADKNELGSKGLFFVFGLS